MKHSLLLFGSILAINLSVVASPATKRTLSTLSSTYLTAAQAQDEDTAYTQVIMQRAAKIVATLEIPDSAAALRVRNLIMDQYRALNAIYNERDARIKNARSQPDADKQAIDSARKNAEEDVTKRLGPLHEEYLARLAKELNPQQIDKVKDGMTYSVLEVTYRAYQDELPDLTEPQKTQILAWLTEAREHAMDAESSEKKHAWFGKYKGRINNYLSAQGIDMKKAHSK